MKRIFIALTWLGQSFAFASSAHLSLAALPESHTELLPYVQEAPDQGDTATCLFMGSTGVVELLLNQKYNIRYPKKIRYFRHLRTILYKS